MQFSGSCLGWQSASSFPSQSVVIDTASRVGHFTRFIQSIRKVIALR
jgi:hypothetical protein